MIGWLVDCWLVVSGVIVFCNASPANYSHIALINTE